MNFTSRWCGFLLVSLIFPSAIVLADTARVAVASNFFGAAKALVAEFEQQTKHQITLIPGSTGKHYAQFKQGAPFEALLGADVLRPRLLEQEGGVVRGSRFTYAMGKLVLWSPTANFVDQEGKILRSGQFRFMAMAQPKLSPYGQAAQQTLEALMGDDLKVMLEGRVVRGENIAQTFQYIKSGNAELGFVAYSQIKPLAADKVGSFWLIPQSMYQPIEQQALLIKNNPAASAFLKFIQSPAGVEIIRGFGYDSPDVN